MEDFAHLVPVFNDSEPKFQQKEIETSCGLSVWVYIKYYWSVTRHKVLLLVSTCHSKWVKRIIYFAHVTGTRLRVYSHASASEAVLRHGSVLR